MTRPIILDSFAGAGGASLGIEMALRRSPDVAINHNAIALGVHAVNHPTTRHLVEDVWRVGPDRLGPIDFAWYSPDCRHFKLGPRRVSLPLFPEEVA